MREKTNNPFEEGHTMSAEEAHHECPLCKHPLVGVPFTVDLTNNLIAFKNKAIQLFPRPTEIIHLLWKRYPNFVSRDTILDKVWPATHDDMPTFHNVYVQIQEARNGLKLLGCGIENANKIGYRIVLDGEDNTIKSLPKAGRRVVFYETRRSLRVIK
jgi:DNA-binding winged helix-turn-helix (wHTH) protein